MGITIWHLRSLTTAHLTNDNNKQVTYEIMTNYVVFLIDGYTITGNPIVVGTIKLYTPNTLLLTTWISLLITTVQTSSVTHAL